MHKSPMLEGYNPDIFQYPKLDQNIPVEISGYNQYFLVQLNPISGYMPNDGHQNQKKIQCWIPIETWDKIEALGYSTTAAAATAAFNKLLEDTVKNPEISQDIPILKARLEEKEKHIETLKTELEKARHDKEAIQNLYNNYMLQMLTLINQKAIEAQGAKKPWWQFWCFM